MARLVPFLILFLIVLTGMSQGQVTRIREGARPEYLMSRKLARGLLVATQDYDYGGPNPKHDPRKGKPGNGGKNP